jgi:CBS domain-containing protein
MKAADVMTTGLVTVEPGDTLRRAAERMLAHHISGLPVVQDGRLAGILTEGDLLCRAEIGTEKHRARWLEWLTRPGVLAEEYVQTHGRRVAEVMTREVVAVAPDTPLVQVVRLMQTHGIRRVPVVDGQQLVGLVSRSDLMKAVLMRLDVDAPCSDSSNDAAICQTILAAIEVQPWGPRHLVDVAVCDGVVEFSGTILDESVRDALRVVAENVPGVRAIRDHLVWLEPVSGLSLPSPDDIKAAQTA